MTVWFKKRPNKTWYVVTYQFDGTLKHYSLEAENRADALQQVEEALGGKPYKALVHSSEWEAWKEANFIKEKR